MLIGENTIVRPYAIVTGTVGRDCHICSFAFVEGTVGDRCTVKNNAQIYEGCVVEDDCFIGPNVVLCNDRYPVSPRSDAERYSGKSWLEPVIVEQGSSLGAGVIVLPGVVIGRGVLIPAGAVVTRTRVLISAAAATL